MTAGPGTVAVVIPTKNGARFIGETIRSVEAQSRQPEEIIVVDDGSTDGTPSIVAAFGSVRLLASSGTGSNPARLTAIEATDSEYIAFLDHDDVWFPHHLETLAGLLDSSPVAVMAYGRLRTFEDHPGVEPATDATPQLLDLWDSFPVNTVGGPSATIVRRSALEQIGGWPGWDRTPSDVYIWYRLADVGPFVLWPAETAAWRRHESSMSRQADPIVYMRERLALVTEALEHHGAENQAGAERLAARLEEFESLVVIFSAIYLGDVPMLRAELETRNAWFRYSPDLTTLVRRALTVAVQDDSTAWSNLLDCCGAWPRNQLQLRKEIIDPIVVRTIMANKELRLRQRRIPLTPGLRHAVRPMLRKLGRMTRIRIARARSTIQLCRSSRR